MSKGMIILLLAAVCWGGVIMLGAAFWRGVNILADFWSPT